MASSTMLRFSILAALLIVLGHAVSDSLCDDAEVISDDALHLLQTKASVTRAGTLRTPADMLEDPKSASFGASEAPPALAEDDLIAHLVLGDSPHPFSALQQAPAPAAETGPAKHSGSAAALTGVSENKEGDLNSFIFAIFFYSMGSAGVAVLFSVMRMRYPQILAYHVQTADVPFKPRETYMGWWSASLSVSIDDAQKYAGLDSAMMLEFCHLCMKILVVVGIPMNLIMCPLNSQLGKAETDKLSVVGMAHIEPGNSIYWLHAAVCWLVIIAVQRMIFTAQQNFLDRRFKWISALPAPRATTILVDDIPLKYRSDAALRDYFATALADGGEVVSAHVVKKTEALTQIVNELNSKKQSLQEAEFKWQNLLRLGKPAADGEEKKETNKADAAAGTTGTGAERPSFQDDAGNSHDSIAHFGEKIEELTQKASEERAKILSSAAAGDAEVFAHAGFVTFKTQREAQLALRARISRDGEEFIISAPPEPSDVIFYDLQQDPDHRERLEYVGWALVIGIFFSFVPFVVTVAMLTDLEQVGKWSPFVYAVVHSAPIMTGLWESIMATAGITIFMSFLPTIIQMISYNFFGLKSLSMVQLRLQGIYFWFQMIFVLFITTIGSSFTKFAEDFIQNASPRLLMTLLATALPYSSHFYLKFICVQWLVQALEIARLAPLLKFHSWSLVVNEERARELAEPENQDYYGIGGRCARMTLVMVIAMVYCTVSPLICLVALCFFYLCRVVYGYLLVFVETRKADLGGVFWVQQLKHVQHGMTVYTFLMLGILSHRSYSMGPCILLAPSLVYLWVSQGRFQSKLQWEDLPISETLLDPDEAEKNRVQRGSYVQPELNQQ
eukprot:gnl/TRDRNA2_/TRDRNA2_37321_c0_seq1.p1 gnl/TRDRNA2_/TRDRNA2_37321_c0~~gnl/TRDRNA2_/TRDRNA2_37321_c0_seq1.p1  ORF type:complete len:844 (-),score=150.09 gnl/TRDRNA2_/TRDRNA2_37321_c0_seq1:157-2688(-)